MAGRARRRQHSWKRFLNIEDPHARPGKARAAACETNFIAGTVRDVVPLGTPLYASHRRVVATSFFEPVDEDAKVFGDYPHHPPEHLHDAFGPAAEGPTIGGVERSGAPTPMQQQMYVPLFNKMKLRCYDAVDVGSKKVEYATEGTWWTLHWHTGIFDASSGKKLAMIAYRWFALRNTYEILSYKPVCETQDPYEYDEGQPIFKYATLTERLFPLIWNRWDLQLANCDNTVEPPIMEVAYRYWLSFLTHLDVHAPGAPDKVFATIDSAGWWQLGTTMNIWLAQGLDKVLLLASAFILDIHGWNGSGNYSGGSSGNH